MIPVIVESPYSGNVALHLRYLRACLRDAVLRGETPYASHHLLTAPGVLRDEVPEERELGINAGFAWRASAKLTVFYEDHGWSRGMYNALADCTMRQLPFERRTLGLGWYEHQLGRERVGAATQDWLLASSTPEPGEITEHVCKECGEHKKRHRVHVPGGYAVARWRYTCGCKL